MIPPQVSVIIPTYNAIEYLGDTLESVLSQSYTNFEVIVVDDCSSDGTKEYLLAIKDSRIKPIILSENSGGPAHPRNVGIKASSGEYFAFLDSDDVWLPNKLQIQMDWLLKTEADFCSTFVHTFRKELTRNLDRVGVEPNIKCYWLSVEALLKKNRVMTSTVVLKATTALHFSEAVRHRAIEDYIAWLTLFQDPNYRGGVLPVKTALYRIHRSSISRSKLAMARKIFGYLGEIDFNGKRLGVKRYYYFFTYAIYSLSPFKNWFR